MDIPDRPLGAALLQDVGATIRAMGAALVAVLVAGFGWMVLQAYEATAGDEMLGGTAGGDGGILSGATSGDGLAGSIAIGDGETAVSLGQPTMPLRHADQRLATALAEEPPVLEPLVKAARTHGVDPRLAVAVAWHESRWDPSARSHAGAVGMMQVQPTTVQRVAREIGESLTPTDPADNATAGVIYLSWLQDNFETTRRALIAYNQGSRALRVDGPYPSAERYAEAVLETRTHLEQAGWMPPSGRR